MPCRVLLQVLCIGQHAVLPVTVKVHAVRTAPADGDIPCIPMSADTQSPPLQATQAAAAKLLSPVLGCLTAYYPQDQFAPGNTPDSASGMSQGVEVVPWLGSKAVEGQTAQLRPQWHKPSPAEMQFAEELMQTFMMDACNQLQQISNGSPQGGKKYDRDQLRGLLLQIEGTTHGLRSALADFAPPAEGQGSGQSLALIGSSSPRVGDGKTRDAVAKSLIAAAGFIGANDYETLGILLRVMTGVLSRGTHEFSESTDSYSSWKSDQDVAFDPPVAALLFHQVQHMSSHMIHAVWQQPTCCCLCAPALFLL